ncbi:MAG: metallophosphoesterase family protein [Candidatus Woesearchaeota archaeon]
MFKFAHIADSHVGGWRDQRLRDAGIEAFKRAIDICIKKNVDFVIIAGDLFDTSLPTIECMNEVTMKLRELKDKNINVYIVPGSHDFSPSGKTFISILESAGLLKNIAIANVVENRLRLEFTVDERTGVKLAGLPGRRGALEKNYYEQLDREFLENAPGFKIFVFHSAVLEFKQEDIYADAIPISLLPKNFNYYAAGHIHTKGLFNEKDYSFIAYPGALFPNNFLEMEKFNFGGFYIVEADEKKILNIEFESIVVRNVYSIKINADSKTPSKVEAEIKGKIADMEFFDTIVLIRIFGKLGSGKTSDVDFKEIISTLYEKGAFFVMKNTSQFFSKDFEETRVNALQPEEIEEKIIEENSNQGIEGFEDSPKEVIKKLMRILSEERDSEETKKVFESRVLSNFKKEFSEKFSEKDKK